MSRQLEIPFRRYQRIIVLEREFFWNQERVKDLLVVRRSYIINQDHPEFNPNRKIISHLNGRRRVKRTTN